LDHSGAHDITELLDDALTELAKLDPRRSRVVEMRYFGGMSVEETAADDRSR
jgi:DNA-directed RNA polymerase specialized sigma24 family protein